MYMLNKCVYLKNEYINEKKLTLMIEIGTEKYFLDFLIK